MSYGPDFDLLYERGDPLEMLICRDIEALYPVLLPYARVWSKHIYPRRVADGSLVEDQWMPFGGNHYTALVRLHHAYYAYTRLQEVFERVAEAFGGGHSLDDYRSLLDAHFLTGAFWENVGAAIDNLDRAWQEAINLLTPNSKLAKEDNGQSPSIHNSVVRNQEKRLADAYTRRTQAIHHMLVPKNLEDGVIVFNPQYYDGATGSWITDTAKKTPLELNLRKMWAELVPAFARAWEKLSSWLQTKDAVVPPAASVTPMPGVLANFVNSHSVPDQPQQGSSSSSPPVFTSNLAEHDFSWFKNEPRETLICP